MSFPTGYNTAGWLNAIRNGNVGIDVFGDSLIAGQPSSTAQGWDNTYYGLLRNWTLTDLRGFSTDLNRDSQYYTPSPDHNGDVTWSTAHPVKKPNASGGNTWLPGAIDEGTLGMLNGLEVAGLTQQTINHVEVSWSGATLTAMAGYPQLGVLQGTGLRVGAILRNHTNGATGSLQLVVTGGDNVSGVINSGSGTEIELYWSTSGGTSGVTDASSATSIDIRFRQVNGNGDQSGNYWRLGQLILQDTDTTGVTITGCGIGGSTIEDITNETGDDPAGLTSDTALAEYRTATGANCAIIMIGRNDVSDDAATLKANYDALIARYEAAGYDYILCVGTPRCTTLTDAQSAKVNQAFYDAAMDAGQAFVSLYSYRMGDTHPNQSEADALAQLLIENVLDAEVNTAGSGEATTTAERVTLSGPTLRALRVRNTDTSTALQVNVPLIHGADDYDTIPFGDSETYSSSNSIGEVNFKTASGTASYSYTVGGTPKRNRRSRNRLRN